MLSSAQFQTKSANTYQDTWPSQGSLYSLFWAIPRGLNFMYRRFGILYPFHLHRCCKLEHSLHHLYKDGTRRVFSNVGTYRSADKSLARPTSRCILFDVENITFDASLVICTNSINIPPNMIINRIYKNQNLLLL